MTPNAKAVLDTLAINSGMTQTALLSRLVDWFVQHELPIQYIALRIFPEEIQRDVAGLLSRGRRGNLR